jgi:hypothetical protein
MNKVGRIWPKPAHGQGKHARVRAGGFVQKPLAISIANEESTTLFPVSLTTSLRPSYFYFFTASSPRPRAGQTPGQNRVYSSPVTLPGDNKYTGSIPEATRAIPLRPCSFTSDWWVGTIPSRIASLIYINFD